MPALPVARILVALALGAPLLDCSGRETPGSATDAGTDAPEAAAATVVGHACASSDDCPAMGCLRVLERECAGPGRPHTWRVEFPGGYCGPTPVLASGTLVAPCPAGSLTWTAFVGCDGIPFRFCARRCASDADCRTAEGYRCQRDLGACAPPAFLSEADDAGT
ncbi:MAG: hypothetical protein Q8S73_06705 [Deltaproteobacteria bacterium]|nr:hypothetical protein [Myxococcales bacterium]MDP3213774.1 hypothetical protein [Deltaproteobacteria bacterium]